MVFVLPGIVADIMVGVIRISVDRAQRWICHLLNHKAQKRSICQMVAMLRVCLLFTYGFEVLFYNKDPFFALILTRARVIQVYYCGRDTCRVELLTDRLLNCRSLSKLSSNGPYRAKSNQDYKTRYMIFTLFEIQKIKGVQSSYR